MILKQCRLEHSPACNHLHEFNVRGWLYQLHAHKPTQGNISTGHAHRGFRSNPGCEIGKVIRAASVKKRVHANTEGNEQDRDRPSRSRSFPENWWFPWVNVNKHQHYFTLWMMPIRIFGYYKH
jgi:hypothetical protein